jgi:hypothetical protein
MMKTSAFHLSAQGKSDTKSELSVKLVAANQRQGKSDTMQILFGTQVADRSNDHQTTLRLAASFDGVASPVPVRKSPCFEARSAS